MSDAGVRSGARRVVTLAATCVCVWGGGGLGGDWGLATVLGPTQSPRLKPASPLLPPRRSPPLPSHNGPAVYTPCDKLVDAMGRFITQRRPGVSFGILGGEKWEDFARLVYAPVAFRDSMSSFGLWATLANTGRVFAPPGLAPIKDSHKSLDYTLPYVDDTYRFVNVPVLYPEVARRLNLTTDLADQSPQIDRIIAWLESN